MNVKTLSNCISVINVKYLRAANIVKKWIDVKIVKAAQVVEIVLVVPIAQNVLLVSTVPIVKMLNVASTVKIYLSIISIW